MEMGLCLAKDTRPSSCLIPPASNGQRGWQIITSLRPILVLTTTRVTSPAMGVRSETRAYQLRTPYGQLKFHLSLPPAKGPNKPSLGVFLTGTSEIASGLPSTSTRKSE